MKKKYLVILLICCAAIGIWRFSLSSTKRPYVRLPLVFKEESNYLPYVEVESEGEKCFLLVDLGFDGEIGLRNHIMAKFQEKIPYENGKWRDVKGKVNESRRYKIPKIQMGGATIENAVAREMDPQQEIQSAILWDPEKKNQNEILTCRGGLIGKRILCQHNLLLDLGRAAFFWVRDVKALKKEGYALENYLEVPFENSQIGIVFQIETDRGIKKFMLDSGASMSLIRPSQEQIGTEIQAQKVVWKKFAMNEKDFGPVDLFLYEFVYPPKEIDGILGADFLQKHVLYLDFEKKVASIN